MEMALNSSYKEILKLAEMLAKAAIPHTLKRCFDGWQVLLIDAHGKQIADAIEHGFSYGHEQDLLEEMGLMDEGDVTGYVTAQEIFTIWKEYSR